MTNLRVGLTLPERHCQTRESQLIQRVECAHPVVLSGLTQQRTARRGVRASRVKDPHVVNSGLISLLFGACPLSVALEVDALKHRRADAIDATSQRIRHVWRPPIREPGKG